MTRTSLLFVLFGLIVIISALHYVALAYFLYWLLPWFDIMMHFLGGLFVALSLLWLTFFSRYIHSPVQSFRNTMFIAVFGTIVVGLVWEFFEYSAWIPLAGNYQVDTTLDLIMDIVGALVAGVLFYAIKKAVVEDGREITKSS